MGFPYIKVMLVDEVCFIPYGRPGKIWFYLCERAKKKKKKKEKKKEINLYPCLIIESEIKRFTVI